MGYMDFQAPQNNQLRSFTESYWQGKKAKSDADAAEQQYKLNALNLTEKEKAIAKQDRSDKIANQLATLKPTEDVTNADGTVTKGLTQADVDKQKADLYQQWAALDPQGMQNNIKALDALDENGQKQAIRKASNLAGAIDKVYTPDGKLDVNMFNKVAPAYGLPQIGAVGADGQPITAEAMDSQLRQAKITVIGAKTYLEDKQKYGYDMEKQKDQQTFTSGENKLNRESEERRTKMSTDATITSAGIHAGASKYATDKQVELYEKGLKGSHGGGYDGMSKAELVEANKSARAILDDPRASDEMKRQAYDVIRETNGRMLGQGSTKTTQPTQSQTTAPSWKQYR